ncbi:MAG TPA: YdbL family protein [Caulobacterales bacterium]|nr:YdbL family protein [Caulobacterales bacterium]
MTRTAPSPLPLAKALLSACALAAALMLASPAHAQDATIAQARAAGVVGEQADGYLGVVQGQTASADVRAHVDQVNIGRRAVYTQRAASRNVSVNEMAAAVACEIFEQRIAVGERYRDENGTWRQRTAATPVVMPSFCPH